MITLNSQMSHLLFFHFMLKCEMQVHHVLHPDELHQTRACDSTVSWRIPSTETSNYASVITTLFAKFAGKWDPYLMKLSCRRRLIEPGGRRTSAAVVADNYVSQAYWKVQGNLLAWNNRPPKEPFITVCGTVINPKTPCLSFQGTLSQASSYNIELHLILSVRAISTSSEIPSNHRVEIILH